VRALEYIGAGLALALFLLALVACCAPMVSEALDDWRRERKERRIRMVEKF
jgi:hypothetical protein